MQISDYVEKALATYPATRDNDRKLIIAVWWLQDINYQDNFKEFFLHKAIMPETITRARRKIQEGGKYRPSKQAQEDRTRKFIDMKYTRGDLHVINNF